MTITIPSSAVEAGAHEYRLITIKPITRTGKTFLSVENILSSLQQIDFTDPTRGDALTNYVTFLFIGHVIFVHNYGLFWLHWSDKLKNFTTQSSHATLPAL